MHKLFISMMFLALSSCALVEANSFDSNEDIIGKPVYYKTGGDETVYQIARKFDLGLIELLAANPGTDIHPPVPYGKTLILPTMHILPAAPRQGIVINLAELRLFYFLDNKTVLSFPIGIGKDGWNTPVGTTTIVKKRKNPVWIPPESIHAETPGLPQSFPPDPDNPLGDYALNLGWPGFVIHGTSAPKSIGTRASHGCIRLFPEDISVLFNNVIVGAPVTIVDQPYKLAWSGDELLLEITPTQAQASEIMKGNAHSADFKKVEIFIMNSVSDKTVLDWDKVRKAAANANGLPVKIGTRY